MTDVAAQPVRSAKRLVEALTAHGVDYVFGVPGAKIDAVFDVLADGGPQVVVCRHEQNAAFMAGVIGRARAPPSPHFSSSSRSPR
ncbi:MAG: acetolactate synthase large subunit [Mycobacterium sp.]|jgi:acetolactate synthase-1/2/3 large subunit|nr:acetolactate synthase large subunit [Mycobacterium sp.]